MSRRLFCFFAIGLNSITAGSFLAFPLFFPPIAKSLHLSASQTGIIATACSLSTYISAAVLGACIDTYGASIVSLLGGVIFGAAYYSMYLISLGGASESSFALLCIAYAAVGCATSASYFSALITAAKVAEPKYAGLAIGASSSLFSLSSLLLSTIATTFFTVKSVPADDVELDSSSFLLFLAILLTCAGIISSFGLRNVTILSSNDNPLESETSERRRLLPAGDLEATSKSDSEPLSLLLSRPSFWLFGVILFLAVGPMEMLLVNLGGVIETLLAPGLGIAGAGGALNLRRRNVQIISIFNTLSRLIVGVGSDYISAPSSSSSPRPPRVSRLTLLFVVCGTLSITFVYAAFKITASGLIYLSMILGTCYGSTFTLAPSILRLVYPPVDFGRNYGLAWFSAGGSLLFTPLYGILADAASRNEETCSGDGCFNEIFVLSSMSLAVAAILCVLLMRGAWKGKV